MRPDRSWLFDRLWQGSRPLCGVSLGEPSPDVLVLCAEEYQPPPLCFSGVRLLYCPLNDDGSPATLAEFQRAHRVAAEATELHRRGARVLVTCHMGLNRSGLVSALMLRQLLRVSGRRAALRVQEKRTGALGNQFFLGHLRNLPAPFERAFVHA